MRLLEPILSGFFAIPLTLFFPLFILFLGIGTASKLAYGALYALLPVALTSIAAFARIDPLLVRAATAMGARPAALLRRVYLPAALPGVLGGMRIALVICIAAVLGGETIASTSGVGYAIKVAEELMDVARMYAWVVFVVLASFALNLLLSAAERWGVES
jgi:ABC-type nitrate/sulfonate/bicarbonate transport system permease component